MQTTREIGRTMALALTIGGTALLGTSTTAFACDGEYEIASGDTLSGIAAKCDISVADLTAANDVDPYALRLGQKLVIPTVESQPVVRESSKLRVTDSAGDTGAPSDRYVVRRGDTLSGIARTLGVSTDTLLSVNPDLDPMSLQIGQRLRVPDEEDVRQILAERQEAEERLARMKADYPNPTLHAEQGAWRRTVDLRASGLAPEETVRVGVSADGRDWLTLGDMSADENGEMVARARIPAELADARVLRFAIQRPWGAAVALAYDPDAASSQRIARAPRDRKLTVAGRVVSGGECDILVTSNGRSFALAGNARVRPGDRVIVIGSAHPQQRRCFGAHAELEIEQINPMPRA